VKLEAVKEQPYQTQKPYLIEKPVESRESARFIPKGNTFVALPIVGRLGSLRNISLGGLGCEFTLNSNEEKAIECSEATEFSVDIMISQHRFNLRGLQCRLTYDVSVTESSSTSYDGLLKRRCGFKFGQLTENQEKQIAHFLKREQQEHQLQRQLSVCK